MKESKVFCGAFFIALFLFFLLPPTDPDLGWQLRCGEQIWRGQGFCSQNQFSVLLAGYSWPNHHWLYQAVVWGIWGRWGVWGLTMAGALVISLAFFFWYLAIPNFRPEKIGLIGLICLIGWGVFSFGMRSQLVGFFFFGFLLWLLSRPEQRPKLMLLVPIVMLVWANSHGGSVVLGLALSFFLGVMGAMRNMRERGWTVLVLLAAGAATLLNPFGWRIYEEAWRHFGLVRLDQLIAEWVPPVPWIWRLTFLGGLGVLGYLGAGGRNLAWALLSLGFTFLGLKARRHLPFTFLLNSFLLLSLPLTKKIFDSWFKKESWRNKLAYLTVVALLSFGLFIRLPQTIHANLSWQNYCQEGAVSYPCQAIEYLKKQSQKGNLFNRYEWGGFLIWQLPEFKVFVDGRMPAWPAYASGPEASAGEPAQVTSPYAIYLETLQTQPGWQETLAKYKIDWILISPGTFMDLVLRDSPHEFGWREAYRDKISVVYERKN
jgi:hypothetical protein